MKKFQEYHEGHLWLANSVEAGSSSAMAVDLVAVIAIVVATHVYTYQSLLNNKNRHPTMDRFSLSLLLMISSLSSLPGTRERSNGCCPKFWFSTLG
ncbi:hypothetical protein PAXINDRAFT_167498 [Paxillus involutus ATCC 200175]|nr:hypothetical protein PAXINDRAFT_167498 [Paxillus involutus ATCC 200175]